MKRVIQMADKLLGHIEKTAALIAGLLILALMTLVCAEVLGRGLFNHPVRGSIDIIEQIMVALVTMGIAYTQSHFGNVRMTLISDRFGGRKKWMSEVFALGIAVFVVVVLTKGSWLNLMRSWNNGGDTPEIGIPLWPGIAIVTAALGLLALRLALQLLEAIRLCAQPNDGSKLFGQPADAIETTPYE